MILPKAWKPYPARRPDQEVRDNAFKLAQGLAEYSALGRLAFQVLLEVLLREWGEEDLLALFRDAIKAVKR